MCIFILEVGRKTHSEISALAKVTQLSGSGRVKPSFMFSQFKYFPVGHALTGPLSGEVVKPSYGSKMCKT